jgi:soluble lytic murein transglycosylase
MMVNRIRLCGAVLALATILSAAVPSMADIYKYVDENGVMHFTNIQPDTRYKLYIKTPDLPPARYIKEYDGIIRQASRQFGVDPSLVKALIKAESDFDQNAVSIKGAQGLMQLMPETADEMAVKSPMNPEDNIYGGTRYLSELLKLFQNDTRLAVAAYNAGPKRVEACNGIPPFPETEQFVARVMRYYDLYRRGGG